jgi:hypothetical protein
MINARPVLDPTSYALKQMQFAVARSHTRLILCNLSRSLGTAALLLTQHGSGDLVTAAISFDEQTMYPRAF